MKIIILTLVLLACVDTIQCQDKTSKNDKGLELSEFYKYAEENKEALKYQDGYSVDDLYDKPDEYSGFESMNKSRNSSSLQVYIDCGINRNLVLGGQLSDAELDKICDRRKKERGNKDAINVLIGIVGVILAVTFYNNWLKPGTDKQKK